MNNVNRQAHFTSSQMYRLVGTPAVRKTYIEETQIEKRMGRCLDVTADSQAMTWGKYMEQRVFKKVGMEYTIVSKTTLLHPDEELAKVWSGSPDMVIFEGNEASTAVEIKCYYPKNFAQLTDALLTEDLEQIKAYNKGKEYWQVVSNAILCGVNEAELITYMPYESELKEIREDIEDFGPEDYWSHRFIIDRDPSTLPILPDNGYYENLNQFSFIIPQSDIDFLTETVKEYSKLIL